MSDVAFQQSFEPLPALFADFCALLRSLSPQDESVPVPGQEWTAREVGVHVLTVVRRYLGPTERAVRRPRLAALNAEDIASIDASSAQVADELDRVIAMLATVAPNVPLDDTRNFHLGLTVSVAAGWANLIGELLVHGDDIARATHRPWSVDDQFLEGVWRNLMPASAGWMRPDARSLTELYHLQFSFGLVVLALDAGTVRVDDQRDAARTPDHMILVPDAAAFTLQCPYRCASLRDPLAALFSRIRSGSRLLALGHRRSEPRSTW
jgi:hypothetical protein